MSVRIAAVLAVLVLAAPAAASEHHPSLGELEGQVMCPVCKTTLDQSDSAIAMRMKQFIAARIRAGDTESQIKAKLVAQFGPAVLAEPSKKGFNLLAWLLPIAGILVGGAVLGVAAWRWSRSRPAPATETAARLDPALDRRLDEELRRFDA